MGALRKALPFQQDLVRRQLAVGQRQDPHCRFALRRGGKVLPKQLMPRQEVEAHPMVRLFQQMPARRFAPPDAGKAMPKHPTLRLVVALPRTAVL